MPAAGLTPGEAPFVPNRSSERYSPRCPLRTGKDVAALLKVNEASYRKGRGRKKAQEKGGNR
jgi:hypothetical protein